MQNELREAREAQRLAEQKKNEAENNVQAIKSQSKVLVQLLPRLALCPRRACYIHLPVNMWVRRLCKRQHVTRSAGPQSALLPCSVCPVSILPAQEAMTGCAPRWRRGRYVVACKPASIPVDTERLGAQPALRDAVHGQLSEVQSGTSPSVAVHTRSYNQPWAIMTSFLRIHWGFRGFQMLSAFQMAAGSRTGLIDLPRLRRYQHVS